MFKESDLTELGFKGPYMHGEYFLYDESCSVKVKHTYTLTKDGSKHTDIEDWCCIMCVYPLEMTGLTNQASYNSQRGMWCNDPKYFDSGWIDFTTLQELKNLIEKSKKLTNNKNTYIK